MRKAERLIKLLLDSSTDDGRFANELLREFQIGFPIDRLRELLSSQDDRVVKIGVWIASELGEKCIQLHNDLIPLLQHCDKEVRFFVIDSLLSIACEGKTIASVVHRLTDVDKAVRWKALDFLYRASFDQLNAALDYFKKHDPQSIHLMGIEFLLNLSNDDAIIDLIQHPDTTLRKYGVVAAARIKKTTREPLEFAVSRGDPELSEFSNYCLKLSDS